MKQKTAIIANLTHGPLVRQLFLFSIPMVAGNLLQTLYTLADMAIVGRFCGSASIAAVSTAGQVMMFLYGLGMALGMGSQILISQQLGSGDRGGVSTTIGTSFTLTATFSLALALLCIFFRRPLLTMMNVPAEAWQEAMDYMLWCAVGIPFNCVCSAMGSVLRGLGDSRHPTVFMAVSAGVNVALDLLLVAAIPLAAAGAAIATTASQVVSCLCCLIFLNRQKENLGVRLRLGRQALDGKTAGTILKLAAPLAVQTMAINVSMMVTNAWINAYGVIASAVTGVGTKLYSLNSLVSGAMMTASATFVGQNIAAGKQERVKSTMRAALLFGLCYWGLSLLICLFFPRAIFSLFVSDAEVLAMAPGYMKIQIFMYLGFALIAPCNGFLNGIGHVKLGLVIAVVDGVIARICLSLLFARVMGLGLEGYWWGSSLAGFVTVIWGWGYYLSGIWKKRKLLVPTKECECP